MEANNGWAEVTTYIEELRFGQYNSKLREYIFDVREYRVERSLK